MADLHAPAAAAFVAVEEVPFVAAAGEASFAAEEELVVDTLAAVAVETEAPFAAAAAAAVGKAPFGSSTVAADYDSLAHTAAAVRRVASFENFLVPQVAVAFVAVDY